MLNQTVNLYLRDRYKEEVKDAEDVLLVEGPEDTRIPSGRQLKLIMGMMLYYRNVKY